MPSEGFEDYFDFGPITSGGIPYPEREAFFPQETKKMFDNLLTIPDFVVWEWELEQPDE